MALNLYLDDCANAGVLANLLRQAGHVVTRPGDVGLGAEADAIHFAFAQTHSLTILTKDPGDFLKLHQADPRHHGILAVYQDNNTGHDMTYAEIVTAIANVELAAQSGGEPVPGKFHNLNLWRF